MQRGFIRCIHERNVNSAFANAMRWLLHSGDSSGSRAGAVLVSPGPVITSYAAPTERVLFSPMRDANPFFHLFESLWMLAGSNDVAWPTQFNSTFGQFSDDGKVFHGAYGYRWRHYFGYDQLKLIVEELQRNPETRRAVLSMWDGGCWGEDNPGDLHKAIEKGSKDVPCNTNVFFRLQGERPRDGLRLDMMVNCRSNDVIWGAYGANAVHFSMLHEFIAAAVGARVGVYYQNSFNFHAYTDRFPVERFQAMAEDANQHDFYADGMVRPGPLVSTPADRWLIDLHAFMELSEAEGDETHTFGDPFFNGVAIPMLRAWRAHKRKEYVTALRSAEEITASDWRRACIMWLERRRLKHESKGSGNAG